MATCYYLLTTLIRGISLFLHALTSILPSNEADAEWTIGLNPLSWHSTIQGCTVSGLTKLDAACFIVKFSGLGNTENLLIIVYSPQVRMSFWDSVEKNIFWSLIAIAFGAVHVQITTSLRSNFRILSRSWQLDIIPNQILYLIDWWLANEPWSGDHAHLTL